MGTILSIIAPVFALILMGALALRTRLMKASAVRGLNDFVFWLAIPALLFGSVGGARQLSPICAALTYLGGAFLVFCVTLFAARAFFGADLARATMIGLN